MGAVSILCPAIGPLNPRGQSSIRTTTNSCNCFHSYSPFPELEKSQERLFILKDSVHVLFFIRRTHTGIDWDEHKVRAVQVSPISSSVGPNGVTATAGSTQLA